MKNIISKLFGKKEKRPEEVTLAFTDLQKFMEPVKGSAEAKDYILRLLELKNYDVQKIVKIANKWSAYIIYTTTKNFLVTFKSGWLWNYGKIFNQPEKEGTGINVTLARYAMRQGVNELLIVRPRAVVYNSKLNDMLDYAIKHKTIREEQGSKEAHIPVTNLKLWVL